MITVEWCPEEECRGTDCPRYRAQKAAWPRTLYVLVRVPHEVKAIRVVVRREAMQQAYLGAVSDVSGGERHLTPGDAAYEVHPMAQLTDEVGTAYAVLYAGAEDPIELGLREPVLDERPDAPGNWTARRRELGELFLTEVLR